MVVDQKIEEAEYFLDKIKNATKREDFIPNLSAFLSATRSIADYLLEDYNLKFGWDISLDDKLYPSTFKEMAGEKNKQNALNFIGYYNTEFGKLRQNKIGKILIDKRDIKVHRTDLPLKAKIWATLIETVHIHDSVSIEVRDKYGNLKNRSNSINNNKSNSGNIQSIKQPLTNTMTVKWFFSDYKSKDVVDVCEIFLKLMKNFVNDLKVEFP
jgi:hypothetical protein